MFKEVLSRASVEFWPSLALVLFFSVLCGAILWVLRSGAKNTYANLAALPFSEIEEQPLNEKEHLDERRA